MKKVTIEIKEKDLNFFKTYRNTNNDQLAIEFALNVLICILERRGEK